MTWPVVTAYIFRYIDALLKPKRQSASLEIWAQHALGYRGISMKMRIFGAAVIASLALLTGSIGQASAGSTCSGNEYNTSNGTSGLNGTNVGTVGPGCLEIGPFGATNPTSVNDSVAKVSNSQNTSIYEFYWGGGNLTIQEEQGSNGIGYNIDVELALLSNVTGVNSGTNGGNLTGTLVNSISIPQATQFTPEYVTLNGAAGENLAAGEYVIDTYLGSCATDCSHAGDSTDPEYAVLFSPTATPLPATLPLFAGGLGMVGFLTRRKNRNAQALAAA